MIKMGFENHCYEKEVLQQIVLFNLKSQDKV